MKNNNKVRHNQKRQSIFNCLFDEVVQGSAVGEDDSKYLLKEQQIITFLNIPWELEKVLYLGYLVCLDAYLFIFTFLPIRTVCTLLKMLSWLCKKVLFLQPSPVDKGLICDLFRLIIMSISLFVLSRVNISMLYHLIRGQSVIKLYFIYNVLEIFDYLCLSFGNDVMDALFWLTIRNKARKREHLSLLWHLVLACIYTLIHSMVFLIQAICLSVAINSHNKSLLVVMTSNQFMELKSYLFKKFDRINNYQIVARDIRERFQYTVIFIVVFVRNMSQLEWQSSHIFDILPDIVLIIVSEVLIDWIKHAFVTRFNGISASSYTDYRFQLYDDLLNPALFRQTFSNRMDMMARKILFIPMPLACLTITVLIEVIPEDMELSMMHYVKYGGAVVLVLFILKVINMGLILHNAERLRAKTTKYTTPRIPPIRNVNSQVQIRLPSPPPFSDGDDDDEDEDPLKNLVSDSASETDVKRTMSEIEDDVVGLRPITKASSAPDLSFTDCLESSPETFHTPHKHSSDTPSLVSSSGGIPFPSGGQSLDTSPTDTEARDESRDSLTRDSSSSRDSTVLERSCHMFPGDFTSRDYPSDYSRDYPRDSSRESPRDGSRESPRDGSRDCHSRKACGCICVCSDGFTSSGSRAPPGFSQIPGHRSPGAQNCHDIENKPPSHIINHLKNVDFKDFDSDGLRKRTVDGTYIED